MTFAISVGLSTSEDSQGDQEVEEFVENQNYQNGIPLKFSDSQFETDLDIHIGRKLLCEYNSVKSYNQNVQTHTGEKLYR